MRCRFVSGRATGRKARFLGLAGSRPHRPPHRPSNLAAQPSLALSRYDCRRRAAALPRTPFRVSQAKPGASPRPRCPRNAMRADGRRAARRRGRARHFAASGRDGTRLGPKRRASPREAFGRFRGLRPAWIRSTVRADPSLRRVLPAALARPRLRAYDKNTAKPTFDGWTFDFRTKKSGDGFTRRRFPRNAKPVRTSGFRPLRTLRRFLLPPFRRGSGCSGGRPS